MIYLSSSIIKANKISEAAEVLAKEGYVNIELSGGTHPYDEMESDLLKLQDQYGISFLCHNYFPPPPVPFVLNLASLDEEVAAMSFEHCKRAIDLSIKLGAEKYAFHAGFLINIPVQQIGKKIKKKSLFDTKLALHKFHIHLDSLMNYAAGRIDLYIENNVLSEENYREFDKQNPFFFTDSQNLKEATSNTGIGHLVDLAHLSVSCNSLGLNYLNELNSLISNTDYIHISDNNGKNDQNLSLQKGSEIFQSLQSINLNKKTITLETYADLDSVRESYDLINSLL
jgi:sugar phosphate isomerase/epimerase